MYIKIKRIPKFWSKRQSLVNYGKQFLSLYNTFKLLQKLFIFSFIPVLFEFAASQLPNLFLQVVKFAYFNALETLTVLFHIGHVSYLLASNA